MPTLNSKTRAMTATETVLGSVRGRTCGDCSRPSLRYSEDAVCIAHADETTRTYARRMMDVEATLVRQMLDEDKAEEHAADYVRRRVLSGKRTPIPANIHNVTALNADGDPVTVDTRWVDSPEFLRRAAQTTEDRKTERQARNLNDDVEAVRQLLAG